MPTLKGVDPLLIRQLRQDNEEAFKVIYSQFYARIYRMIFSLIKSREQSEEILQETFVSLWLNRRKFDETLPLSPWLYLTARRLTIDAFRKISTETSFKDRLRGRRTALSNETEESILTSDLQRLVDDALHLLPPRQQIVFSLSRKEGLSYNEIAEKLHISRNTVRNHLVCALKTLRAHLSEENITYMCLLWCLLRP